MQNNQIFQINMNSDDLARLYHLLNHEVLKTSSGSHRLCFQDEAAYFRGFFSYFIDKSKQPDGVGRSPVQSSGVLDQVTTYPFVVGE